MVAKIATPNRLLDVVNYNEKKVQRGDAECIGAANYLWEAREMSFYQKLAGLERLNVLNDRAVTKTIHISLNFHPSEKPSNGTLRQIADAYMERIGFGNQPYLVYRHYDAGHPHLHIVSTLIRENGSRINTHNLGRNASEKARKELEIEFGLVRAEDQRKSLDRTIGPMEPAKVVYGKSESKKSMAQVVEYVLRTYAFTSLPEFNAALRQYNVLADRGQEQGRTYRNRGLVYRILDERGEKVGVPVKASALSGRPTLDVVEGCFAVNEKRRVEQAPQLKDKLDRSLATAPKSLEELKACLERMNIYVIPRTNKEGRVYGITFVDNDTRCVFNGSALGRSYSAAAILSRLQAHTEAQKEAVERPVEWIEMHRGNKARSIIPELDPAPCAHVLDVLVQGRPGSDLWPSALLKRKKKRKKRLQRS